MFKKLILVGFVFLFLGVKSVYAADIVIDEFVSHPNSGEDEWVELFNTTENSIDLTGWKLTQLTNPSTNPKEDTPLLLSGTILSGGVFVIKFSNLNDGGDSISLYDLSSSLISRVTYGKVANMSADLAFPLQGKSGALISGVWKTNQEPTKGELNPGLPTTDSSVSDVSTDDETVATSSSSSISSEPKVKVVANPTMKVKILTNALAFTGQPLEMQTSVVGFLNEKVILGKAYWNFGDGSSFEQINNFEKFSHIYYYPGEYVLFLEYYQNSFSKTLEATAKMIIKVLPTSVSIARVRD